MLDAVAVEIVKNLAFTLREEEVIGRVYEEDTVVNQAHSTKPAFQ